MSAYFIIPTLLSPMLSDAGLMLFVKPSDISAGIATKLIGAVSTGAWDSQPDDLTKLAIPVDLQGTNLIGGLGPAGASLYDLIDAGTLSQLLEAGDCGASDRPLSRRILQPEQPRSAHAPG